MTYELSTTWTVVLIIGVVWELIWKGIAMWRAARLDQPAWFWTMLVISSVGVLPILYLLFSHEHGHHPAATKGMVA